MAKKAAKKTAGTAEEKPVLENKKKPTHAVVKRLAEHGETYAPGDEIHLTKKRAEALGDLVKPL